MFQQIVFWCGAPVSFRRILKLVGCAAMAFSTSGFAQDVKLKKVLPVHRPDAGRKTIIIPLTNPHSKPLEINSHSASCLCSRDVRFEKLSIEPGQTTNVELRYEVPAAAAGDDLKLTFSIAGRLAFTDEKPHQRNIGQFEFIVPIREPVALRKHEQMSVLETKAGNFVLLNTTGTKWSRVIARHAYEGITTDCEVRDYDIGEYVYQQVSVTVDGLQRFFQEEKKPEEFTFELYASFGDNDFLESVGTVTVPVRWTSAIEYFPKTIDVGSIKDELEINVVGRGIPVADFANELEVFIGARELEAAQFKVTTLSRKWVRISIIREQINANPMSENIAVNIPSLKLNVKVNLTSQ